jgi:hypothetical protein
MIFEQASPTFKARYMWMAGLEHDEEGFDAMAREMDLRPLVEGMEVPWLVVAGDADELSPVHWSYDLAARSAGPTALLVYHQGRHALSLPTTSVALGPQWVTYSADWLMDRVEGRPLEERFDFVTESGTVEQRLHPREGR